MPKSKTYEEFVEKFKPKKTTDDCFTPPLVYDAVLEWVVKEYGIDAEHVVRPFWPGKNYQAQEYPENCVVVDNPPFSILSKICEYYLDRGIRFFLFAPSLTALSGKSACMKMNHIICDAHIVYDNGALIRTAFVTNLGDEETVIQAAPSLGSAIEDAVRKTREETIKKPPKYAYPDHVVTAAMVQRYSKHGIDFKVKQSECVYISSLDEQKSCGKGIFGGGLLLCDQAAERKIAAERAAERAAEKAAEKAAAERERAATVWKISERERAIIAEMSAKNQVEKG